MERVETLCNLLAEKIQNKATISELLTTVKMLESELLHLKTITPPVENSLDKSAIHIAVKPILEEDKIVDVEPEEEEKTVEVLQINEEDIEAELEEIKRIVADRNRFSQQNKPAIAFDEMDEIPTMAGRQATVKELNETIAAEQVIGVNKTNASLNDTIVQDIEDLPEINEAIVAEPTTSLNDKLASTQAELSDTLKEAPIKDIKKAIGVNERFLYLNELFRGDEAMYERSIKTINAFTAFPEAEYWIRRELKLKLGWDDKYQTVKQFDSLVRRRFA
jgi:DNA-binding transcriptional ArsR family regulator